jgi:hypothetical protein
MERTDMDTTIIAFTGGAEIVTEMLAVTKEIDWVLSEVKGGKLKHRQLFIDFMETTIASSGLMGKISEASHIPEITRVALLNAPLSLIKQAEKYGFNQNSKIQIFPMFRKKDVEVRE